MPSEWLLYLILGAAAGLLAGLLGVGGGLVLVAALAWLLPSQGVPPAAAMHAALATSLASIVLTASVSSYAHHRRGSVLWPSVAWLLPGLLLGGWLGAEVATRVSGEHLRRWVAGYCVLAAMQLALGWPRQRLGCSESPRGVLLSGAGIVIGAISALVGIGGGSMTVPLLTWRGVPAVRAVATSSACGVGIGLAGAIGYANQANAIGMPAGSWGYVFLPAAVAIAIASMAAAPYGVRLAHRLNPNRLKHIFAAFLLMVAAMLGF